MKKIINLLFLVLLMLPAYLFFTDQVFAIQCSSITRQAECAGCQAEGLGCHWRTVDNKCVAKTDAACTSGDPYYGYGCPSGYSVNTSCPNGGIDHILKNCKDGLMCEIPVYDCYGNNCSDRSGTTLGKEKCYESPICGGGSSTPVPSVCEPLYYCDKVLRSCVLTSANYDNQTHVQCGGTNTCEQNLQLYIPSRVTNDAQCYPQSDLDTCLRGCTAVSRTPVPTSTATSTPTAMCQNVKAYDTNWTQLFAPALFNYKSGQKLYFCVAGTTNSGSFDKAQFTINNVAQAETTLKRPGSDDFCQLYTIPVNTYNFVITAKVHHPLLGWL